MNILLDTHYVLWSLFDSNYLNNDVIEMIEDLNNDIYVSSASIWEISNKHLKKPEAMPISGYELYKECLNNDYLILPIQAKVIEEYDNLKLKDNATINKDPFDRMLVAQAKHYNYTLLTHDHCMEYYLEKCIMIK